jgi:hypothetical protein
MCAAPEVAPDETAAVMPLRLPAAAPMA